MKKAIFIILLFLAVNTNFLQAQFAGGTGTIGDPYQIADVDQLQLMNNFLSNQFILINDIDASATSGWNGGAGFEPVGVNFSNPFTGSLTGNDFTITGLTINRPLQDMIGLFGANLGDIIDVVMENVNITGRNFTGGLVGFSNGGAITNSYATGTVAGNNVVGGLVGISRSTITTSYATGTVSGNDLVGGLVGENQGIITNSYATGTVSGNDLVGGLVGLNTILGSTITISYATGTVSGNTRTGGLMGSNNGAVTNSYWNITTTGQGSSDGGTGLTECPQFRQQDSFTGFDFVDVWDIEENETYPFLQDNTQNPLPGVPGDINPTFTSSGFLPIGTYQNVTISGIGTVVTMTCDVTVLGELTLTAGKIVIGSNTLTLSGPINFNGGRISSSYDLGTSGSNLVINGAGTVTGDLLISGSKYINNVSILRNEDFNLGGETHVLGDLTLDDGATLSIGNNNLHLYGDLDLGISGTLEGGPGAYLLLKGSGDITLPGITLGHLAVQRDNIVTLSEELTILKNLRMYNGTLNTGDNLTLSNGCNLWINSGQITGTPTFGLKHNIYYEDGNGMIITGSELTNPNNIPLITVKSTIPLVIQNDILSLQRMIIYPGSEVDVNGKNISLAGTGTIEERNGGLLFSSSNGTVIITKNIGKVTGLDVGGLGVILTTRKNLGSTEVVRGFEAQNIEDDTGIERYYDINPANTNNNLDFVFNYHESELNNNDEGSLLLYIHNGITWDLLGDGGVVDMENNTITVTELIGDNKITGRVTAKGDQIGEEAIVVNDPTRREGNDRTKDNDKKKGNDRTKGEEKTKDIDQTKDRVDQLKTKGDVESHKDENISETEIIPEIPSEAGLLQNYPNPFNPVTQIRFALPESDLVTVKVFDISGREIAELVNGNLNAGYHTVQFDGTNLSSGIYFYRISTSSGFKKVMRMSLIK